MILSLLLPAASASIFHLLQWQDNSRCATPPDVVYGMQAEHELKFIQGENEVWPPFMQYWAPFWPIGVCGNLVSRMDGLCCTSILTPEKFGGITSVTTLDAPTLPANQATFPTVMANAQFCVLSNFMGYPELYVGTSGACIEGVLTCSTSGALSIYPEPGCMGTAQTYPLTATPSGHTDSSINSTFTGEFRRISSAPAKKIGWTEQMPSTLLVIDNSTVMGGFATACYVIIAAFEAGMLVYFSYRLFKIRTLGGLFLVICHFFWVLYIALIINYNYRAFANKTELLNSLAAWAFFYGLATLMTAICTTNFIVVFWRLDKLKIILLYAAVFSVHFGLTGDRYLYGWLYRADAPTPFDDALTIWGSQVSFVWIVFLIVYDLIPICIVVARASLLNPGSFWQKLKTAMEIDLVAAVMFYFQFFIVIGYSLNEYFRQQTPIMGDDKNYMASKSFSIILMVTHSLLNTIIIFRIARSIQDGKFGPSSKSGKSWKSETASSKISTKVETDNTEH